ncbi:MAG: Tetratricopeptide 2 repeat protein [Deltaproteobacteria bacterium]|nr:Tetratricopeptide 2 repeat protein [Deltaproteobacteria bacterium]
MMSRKKKIVLTVVAVTLAVGFLICSAVIILKRIKESGNSNMALLTQRPSVRGIISIELMEKIEDLKETLREDPKNLHAWLKLGDIYFDYNKYREASEAYRQYLSMKPENPDVRTRMGMMLRGLGDFDGAIEAFRRASHINSKHAESRFQLGALFLQEKKDVNEAITAWEDYLQVEVKNARARWVRAEIERLKTMKEGEE